MENEEEVAPPIGGGREPGKVYSSSHGEQISAGVDGAGADDDEQDDEDTVEDGEEEEEDTGGPSASSGQADGAEKSRSTSSKEKLASYVREEQEVTWKWYTPTQSDGFRVEARNSPHRARWSSVFTEFCVAG